MLPPAVAGIGLLAAFGRLGLLGGTFDALGIDVAFNKVAVVLAVTFVASPFYVRTAVAAFETLDPNLPAAARTLGAGPGRVFFRVALPLAAGGLGAGAALAFARGIGEFGATIMFAGSLQGVTQTLSLAIYEQFDLDFDVALAISAVLVVISAATLLVRQAGHPMALDLELTHSLRSFDAAVELTRRRRRDVRARRTVGRGQDDRAAGRSPGCSLRTRAASSSRARRGSTRAGASTCRPSGGASATCSRSTRSSRTST